MDRLLEAGRVREADPEGQAAQAEAELARRVAAGDAAAWDAFFTRFSDWAYRFAYHHLNGNRAEAEDLCSDILLTAARSLRTFDRRRGTLDVWLLTLARRRLARFCHVRRRQAPLIPDTQRAGEGEGLALPTDLALTRTVVQRALASLPERQARVLIGKYVAGQSVEELARHFDTTPKAVESLLSRARAGFRQAFTARSSDHQGGDRHD